MLNNYQFFTNKVDQILAESNILKRYANENQDELNWKYLSAN
jgi:hypothetical protein